jgi:hypothetical protein
MAAKHFIIYYKRGTGTFVVTEPRPWANENREHFPGYDFINQKPTTNAVEQFLRVHLGFREVISNNDVVLLQNLDTNNTL